MLKNYTKEDEQLNSVCERERQIRKSYVYFSMNSLNDLCLCVSSFTAVLCCSALLTVFLFVSRAFISGAFQGAYIYTPEVKIGSFYLLGQRELGQNFVFISAENRLCLVWILFYSLVRTNVSLCTQLTVDNGSLSTDYQNILVEQSL